MIPGGSWVYQELLKMSLLECYSLFYKDNHLDCHLAANSNLSFPFSAHSFSVSYSVHGQWEGKVIVVYKLSKDTFQGIFSNASEDDNYRSFVCRPVWDLKPLHWIISIFETISDILERHSNLLSPPTLLSKISASPNCLLCLHFHFLINYPSHSLQNFFHKNKLKQLPKTVMSWCNEMNGKVVYGLILGVRGWGWGGGHTCNESTSLRSSDSGTNQWLRWP